MKKTNKGFSLVELIIVIAIMAILAGALAPALIKYISKSRLSSDIQTASAIATACQTALSSEGGFDAAADTTKPYSAGTTMTNLYTQTDCFAASVKNTCGTSQPKVKAKKCMKKAAQCSASAGSGTAYGTDFTVKVSTIDNEVSISIGDHAVYPTADKCMADE